MSNRILHSLACVAILVAAPALTADMHWGPITQKACGVSGLREWSGVLWDIPAGESWEDACHRTPAIDGGRPPNACVVDLNMWGIWYVPDRGCLQNPREDALLVFDFRMRNDIPGEDVRFELVVEHVATVGPYEVVSTRERGRYSVPIPSARSGNARPTFPYEGGLWIVRAQAWVAGRMVVERRAEMNFSHVPPEGATQNIWLEVRRLRNGRGYVVDLSTTR